MNDSMLILFNRTDGKAMVSIGGKVLYGVHELHLSKSECSVLGPDGKDLLSDLGDGASPAEKPISALAREVAAFFETDEQAD